MRTLAFTADVDRDVNLQIPGRVEAGSIDRGSGDSPRFSSSEKGLGILLDVMDEVGIRGTLFFEGRTSQIIDCSGASGHCIGLHGYDHEDMTGLSDEALEDVVLKSFSAVSDGVGRPTCFRAPYMTADGRVLEAVRATGIRDDSSFYTSADGPWSGYEMSGMTEHPVARSRDGRGKVIAAYLWPMHEGKRDPKDYIEMAEGIEGELVLADHSWHLAEGRQSGPYGPDGERRAAEQVREVLSGVLDLGFRPVVIGR